MKKLNKFLRKNKGVILFYILVIMLSLGCSYRLNRLNEKENDLAYTYNDYQVKGVNA